MFIPVNKLKKNRKRKDMGVVRKRKTPLPKPIKGLT